MKIKNYIPAIIVAFVFLILLSIIGTHQKISGTSLTGWSYNYGSLQGANLKVPIYDRNNVTLTWGTMTFVDVDSKKLYSIIPFGNILKTNVVQLLPLRITSDKEKEKYVLVAYILQDHKWVQKQWVLFGVDIKNQKIELSQNIIKAEFDTVDVHGDSVHKEVYFKIDEIGHFSLYFPKIDGGIMGLDIIKNTWKWKQTTYATGATISPKKDVFSLKMDENGKFSAHTDCNTLAWNFTVAGNGTAQFKDIVSTMIACPDSQEAQFSKMLEEVKSFTQTGATLDFWLKTGSGSMMFEKMETPIPSR